ncbi:MAG: helix-turn-helix transcriptional regulator [Actinomycetota bacterium]|nr:helix-turn-helix transcriptional regulator [Actinomycetota bacterium]MDI6822102.1 helix-turn-helix transcriptional regulator [Actinomycetota bacterium]
MKYSHELFHEALTELFKQCGVSLRKFARRCKVDYTYLSKLKRGRMPAPSDEVIRRIAAGFGISPDYFMEYRVRKVSRYLMLKPNLTTALYRLANLPIEVQKKIESKIIRALEKDFLNVPG